MIDSRSLKMLSLVLILFAASAWAEPGPLSGSGTGSGELGSPQTSNDQCREVTLAPGSVFESRTCEGNARYSYFGDSSYTDGLSINVNGYLSETEMSLDPNNTPTDGELLSDGTDEHKVVPKISCTLQGFNELCKDFYGDPKTNNEGQYCHCIKPDGRATTVYYNSKTMDCDVLKNACRIRPYPRSLSDEAIGAFE